MSRIVSLILVCREHEGRQQVLLGEKLRGFGAGRVVAPGGTASDGECPNQAASRELAEETGLTIAAEDLTALGQIRFDFLGKPEAALFAHVFLAQHEGNEPQDSDELASRWFDVADLPFDLMWPDSALWLPDALASEPTNWRFVYGAKGKSLKRHEKLAAPQAPSACDND